MNENLEKEELENDFCIENYYNLSDFLLKKFENAGWVVFKDEETKKFTIQGPVFSDMDFMYMFDRLIKQNYTIQCGGFIPLHAQNKEDIKHDFQNYGYTWEEPEIMFDRLIKKIYLSLK